MTEREKLQNITVVEIQSAAMDILGGKIQGLRNLKNIRQQKYGSQKKLCDLLGFDRTTYNSWELCKHWPKADAVILIAAALGCTIEELFMDPQLYELRQRREAENHVDS